MPLQPDVSTLNIASTGNQIWMLFPIIFFFFTFPCSAATNHFVVPVCCLVMQER